MIKRNNYTESHFFLMQTLCRENEVPVKQSFFDMFLDQIKSNFKLFLAVRITFNGSF